MKKRRILNQQGFSLMEILIALSLMAIGGTFVVSKLFDRLESGKRDAAKIQISSFKQLLEDYRRYCGQYPSTEQGLDALVAKPTTAPDCPNYPASGFIDGNKVPKDPWETSYAYETPDGGKTYVITSYASDRKEGGEGNGADIKSNDL